MNKNTKQNQRLIQKAVKQNGLPRADRPGHYTLSTSADKNLAMCVLHNSDAAGNIDSRTCFTALNPARECYKRQTARNTKRA